MAENINTRFLTKLPKFNNYNCVLPNMEDYLTERPYILWIHNIDLPSEFFNFISHNVEKFEKIIAVSEWHKKELLKLISIEPQKIVIISNAVDEIDYSLDRFNKVDTIKIIHCSAPQRGLNILLNSIKNIEGNVEFHIFNHYYPDLLPIQDRLYIESLIKNKKVYFYGLTPRKTVQKYMSESHIFAYPAFNEETFCIAQAEAMSTGCLSVTSTMGALKETAGGFSLTCDFDNYDFEKNVQRYAELLNHSINMIKNKEWSPENQCDFIKNNYSWDSIYKDWIRLHDSLT